MILDPMVIDSFINTFALCFFRVIGCLILLPLGSHFTDAIKKIGLAFIFAIVISLTWKHSPDVSIQAILIELLLGISVSLPLVLIVYVSKMIPELIDVARGQSIAQQYGASIPESLGGGGVGLLGFYLSFALILQSGILIEVMKRLFIQSSPILYKQSLTELLLENSYQMYVYVSTLLTSSFSVLLPIAGVYLLVEISFAFLSKALPKIPFFGESFQIKGLATLLIAYSIIRSGEYGNSLAHLSHPDNLSLFLK